MTLEDLASEVAYLREKLAGIEETVEGHREQIHSLANGLNTLLLREERARLKKAKG